MEIEDALRFDQYSVQPSKHGMQVIQLMKDVGFIFAVITAGISQREFEQSMEYTGWVGSCPGWLRHMPVVTVPKDQLLNVDHLDFIVEVLE